MSLKFVNPNKYITKSRKQKYSNPTINVNTIITGTKDHAKHYFHRWFNKRAQTKSKSTYTVSRLKVLKRAFLKH